MVNFELRDLPIELANLVAELLLRGPRNHFIVARLNSVPFKGTISLFEFLNNRPPHVLCLLRLQNLLV